MSAQSIESDSIAFGLINHEAYAYNFKYMLYNIYSLNNEGMDEEMAKLNIMDIVALAKQGFTPAAVKELTEMEVPDNASSDIDGSEENKDTSKGKTENAPKEDAQDQKPGNESDADAIDYNKQLEELKKENENLKKSIQELQVANSKRNASNNEDKESAADKLTEAFRRIM